MTDRYRTLVVVLEASAREDDLQPLMDAICMLQGVAYVDLGELEQGEGQQ